jgi:ketosteroid isomerase-like protein
MTGEFGRRRLIESTMLLGAGATMGAALADVSVGGEAVAAVPTLNPFFDQKIADEIITHATSLEVAETLKDTDKYVGLLKEDYTEINPHFSITLKGRDTIRKIQEFNKAAPQKITCNAITNPVVRVYGDVALLLYISLRVIENGAGETDPACRRVTRVYAREDGKWGLVHSHFSAFDYKSTY